MNLLPITLDINGEKRLVSIRAADTLLYVLREKLGLTGSKPGCSNGDCGACTITINGSPMKSCLMLAIEAVDLEIMTIEGLKAAPIQIAFVEEFAFQCGYCTPGFIMNSHSLVNHHPNASDKQLKEWLSSNICRCTGYEEIERAVRSVLRKNNEEN
ncbi:(2Fe-2S)-binding protein [Halalkalibacter nanhaiisediminis]|uniref:Carbon-monoxide dehydrogenase small subunit n=1 Tax=Halalkalibacter nanhaiisediminis TaxID=688079 RepID=A0A562QU68_9BACI|nr:(2Fe-2S)-binding protein [Halalkalibacter nanhaiisediminis]TWI59666.1 carbon-monoxide dehydrogenase small subunit [Halalkalibacter nanhaiisediminis]